MLTRRNGKKSRLLSTQKMDVLKDACNIAEINSKYAKFFAEKTKNETRDVSYLHIL
jgi:hypothetical protein